MYARRNSKGLGSSKDVSVALTLFLLAVALSQLVTFGIFHLFLLLFSALDFAFFLLKYSF